MRLRRMTDDERTAWLARVRSAYVEDRVAAGETQDVAGAVAAEQFGRFFPDGRPAPGHDVFVVELAGAPVGSVWTGPDPGRPEDGRLAWLYDIEITPSERGRGLGRAALAALERHCAETGATELGLNVFGQNTVARALYTSAGYRDVAVTMTKALPPAQDA